MDEKMDGLMDKQKQRVCLPIKMGKWRRNPGEEGLDEAFYSLPKH